MNYRQCGDCHDSEKPVYDKVLLTFRSAPAYEKGNKKHVNRAVFTPEMKKNQY